MNINFCEQHVIKAIVHATLNFGVQSKDELWKSTSMKEYIGARMEHHNDLK